MKPFPLALVGCGKAKAEEPRPARKLYTSGLFRLSFAYAQAQARQVFIVSAHHGLVHPEGTLFPYEGTLAQMTSERQQGWARGVVAQVEALASTHEERALLLLAGGTYAALLEEHLGRAGWRVEQPLRGLPIGKRLHWLSTETRRAA